MAAARVRTHTLISNHIPLEAVPTTDQNQRTRKKEKAEAGRLFPSFHSPMPAPAPAPAPQGHTATSYATPSTDPPPLSPATA